MRESKFKIFAVLFVFLYALYIAFPSFVSDKTFQKLPKWLQGDKVALGLDLKGGAYILLEADIDTVIKDKIAQLKDIIRKELRADKSRNNETIAYTNLVGTNNFASVIIKDSTKIKQAIKRIKNATMGEVNIETENNKLKLFYTEDRIKQIKDDVLSRSIEIVRKRIDSLGNKEPSIQKQGDNRIMVQLPGVDNPDRVKELLGKTAKMTFHLVSEESMTTGTPLIDEEIVDGIIIKKRIAVSGENLTDSRVVYDTNGRPAVSTTFDSIGGREFAKLTEANVGKRFAIVLDGKILSAPVIQEAITGGHGQITGGFTTEQAKDLSTMLRSGALPCEMTVVEERTVGAGLGADSIKKGSVASLFALLLVLVFMISTYGTLGIFSDIVLILNILLIFAGLTLSGATLTLPGIAGIALNIGMAVDANILIFERMREEAKAGINLIKTIENGFSNAISSIMDSNITTLASAFVMFQFGSGPVKGFAVTLTLGILTSLFTNITCLKLILNLWAGKDKAKKLDL